MSAPSLRDGTQFPAGVTAPDGRALRLASVGGLPVGGHEIVPVHDTYKRVRDGKPVAPPMPWDYPITAECEECHGSVRMRSAMFSDWEHDAVSTASTLPARTPVLDRIAAFRQRRPDIPITDKRDSPSGKWETREPGQDEPTLWGHSTAMMNHLEAAYPDSG